ncbi:phospholipase [Xenorhabdus griffiniae]|uniref:Phospholipase n=1 Tax=Xenorhabdus griffiniae TaxID=351672 RepID=A0ABY9XKU9_9GAMM|nr:phospholipase [Xenorhabdus griffiniae]WMV73564.1 phospholipase [Xenorhabdus griffiniae]WNH03244.1 phospholipase [Xenorhabdus griffiniae]
MTLSVNTDFFRGPGIYSLQENALQPQPNSSAQSPPDEVEHISSPGISLSENTKQVNALYQSLVNNLNASTMAAPELKANDIAGKQSKLVDYNLTLVTRDVYRQTSLGIGDYVRLSDEDLSKLGIDPDTLNDYSTGFQAGVYHNKGLYIVSFTGSNELQDFMVSIRQGLGFNEKQYNQAVELAHKSLEVFGENVIFTGHSLGGGLATVAALATGKPAVIYNSVSVSDATLKYMGVSPEVAREMADSGLIRHYTVQHDWLGNLQKTLPIRQPMGHEVELKYEYELESIWDVMLPNRYGLHTFKAHFLEAVLELMAEQKPWLNNGNTMLASTDVTDTDLTLQQGEQPYAV